MTSTSTSKVLKTVFLTIIISGTVACRHNSSNLSEVNAADAVSNIPKENPTNMSNDDAKNILMGTRSGGKTWTKDLINGVNASDHPCSATITDKAVKIHIGGPDVGRGLNYNFDISSKAFDNVRMKEECRDGTGSCADEEKDTVVLLTGHEKPTPLAIERELIVRANLKKKTFTVSIFSYQKIVLSSLWGGAECFFNKL